MTTIKKPNTAPKKRGPKGARGRPVNPDRIRKIVKLRDEKGLSFLEIAQKLGDDPPMTEQAIYFAYTRWADWARDNPNSRASSPVRG